MLARFGEQLLDNVEGFDEVRVLEVAEVADAEDLALELALAAAEHDAVLFARCWEDDAAALNELALALASQGKNAQDVLQDVFWALLNSREFMFNH